MTTIGFVCKSAGGKVWRPSGPDAGPLRDVGGRNSVAAELGPHALDPAVENAGALIRVPRHLRPRVDVDQRDRLRRTARGGVDDLLPAISRERRAAPRPRLENVALDDWGRRAACRREGDRAGEKNAPHPCHAATVFSAEKP